MQTDEPVLSSTSERADTLRTRIRGLMPQAKADLAQMVSYKSVADPKQFPREECDKMVDFLVKAFKEVGLDDAQAYETSDGSHTVCGHSKTLDGAPTVLLYCHHDVQPPQDESLWETPAWELTEKSDGRWYGRGTADCKGNIALHLTALRALGDDLPVNVTLVSEGSEEQGTGGLEKFVPLNQELLKADAILICDSGNVEVGQPSLTTTLRGCANVVVTVRTLRYSMHSGMFGGAAPDALSALIQMLATLRDAKGNTTVGSLDNTQTWDGIQYDPEVFRKDATMLEGVSILGDGTIADMVWARPTATILGIDCPPVVGSSGALPPEATALVSLRVPPGMSAVSAQEALVNHLKAAAPWNVHIDIKTDFVGEPFATQASGAGFNILSQAMQDAYGRETAVQGHGGSIPLCNVFQETYPNAEIMLLGVEEPLCLIHSPNESVDPNEIEQIALAEALFLDRYRVG